MSANELQNIKSAHELIEQARAEETQVGNPMTAVRCYTTAMELITTTAYQRAMTMTDLNQKRFFLNQVRYRLEMYHERAVLLLQVALGSGLVDKPSGIPSALPAGGGGASMLPSAPPPGLAGAASSGPGGAPSSGLPPPLYANVSPSPGAAGGGGAGGNSAVMGIPLPPPSAESSPRPPPPPSSRPSTLPPGYYQSPPSGSPDGGDSGNGLPPPPPSFSKLDVDELLRNLGAPPDI